MFMICICFVNPDRAILIRIAMLPIFITYMLYKDTNKRIK